MNQNTLAMLAFTAWCALIFAGVAWMERRERRHLQASVDAARTRPAASTDTTRRQQP